MNLFNVMNKDLVLNSVINCEGLTEVSTKNGYVYAYDVKEDIELHFNYEVNFNNLFDFGSLKIDKELFFKVIENNLDENLFLMPQKIFFISSEEELYNLLSRTEYELQGMDFNKNLGINWSYDSTIVINIYKCKEVAKELVAKLNSTLDDVFNEILWITLIHELRHMLCDLGFIISEEIIPKEEISEENVEKYGFNCFWNNIYYDDYKCFKYE